MNLASITVASEYNKKTLLETQIEYDKFVEKAAQITEKNNSELIKNINGYGYKNDMSLKKIVDNLLEVYDNTKDKVIFAEARIYFLDAEKYKLIGEQHTFKYLKRKCVEKFERIKDPELIQKFKKEMGSYLPKKYLK